MSPFATPSIARSSVRTADMWLLVAAYSILYAAMNYVLTNVVFSHVSVEVTWAGLEGEFDERRKRWQLIGYALTPCLVVLRSGFAAVCLAVGMALLDWCVRFVELYRAALVAECVWAVAGVTHVVCLKYLVDLESFADFAAFYPLSATQLVDFGKEDLWSLYLLKTVNLFEVVYAGALTLAVWHVVDQPLPRLAAAVVISYGCGLLLLVASVTFALMALT